MLPRPSGTVVLLTDFGTRDPYVGQMKGMVLRSHPKAVLVDLSHDVPPQDVALGAFFLRSAVGRFPPGSIVVGVVDPGVGTDRRVLCGCRHALYWIAPDNGLLGEVLSLPGDGELRAVDQAHLGLPRPSRTFHGRDLLAPLAGNLAAGRYGFSSIGPRIDDPVQLRPFAAGARRVVHVDHYGNLLTNVTAAAAAGARAVRIAGRRVPIGGRYADAERGEPLALVNSYDLLEIAVNLGSAAATLCAGLGAEIELED